jgi:hypothetical protein
MYRLAGRDPRPPTSGGLFPGTRRFNSCRIAAIPCDRVFERTSKSNSVLVAVILLFSKGLLAQKPTVLISGNGNTSIASNNAGAGLSQTTVSKHDQTMEMAQDFLQFCSSSEVTLDQVAVPDYFVFLNRKGSPTAFGEVGQSQIMVLNRKKSPILVAKMATVKNAVKHACNAIAEDWQAHGRLPVSGSPTAADLSVGPAVNVPNAVPAETPKETIGAPGTVAVVIQPTASALRACKPETISSVLNDTNAYVTSKGMTLGTTENSSRSLVLILNRPVTRWMEITIQERDRSGNVLWSEKVSEGGGWAIRMGTAALVDMLEKVHKIIDAKMPGGGVSNPEAGLKK